MLTKVLEVLLKFHGSPGLMLMVDALGCRDTRLLNPLVALSELFLCPHPPTGHGFPAGLYDERE